MNLPKSTAWDLLREPETGSALHVYSRAEAEAELGEPLVALRMNGLDQAPPLGVTDYVLGTGRGAFYPIIGSVPVLLGPEVLGQRSEQRSIDIGSPAFEEAYLEMEFYNQYADSESNALADSSDFAILSRIREADLSTSTFPHPDGLWIDAAHDAQAQLDAYQELSPVREKRLLQIGGKGLHAIKFLLGGASETWLVTPMVGEAAFATRLAEAFGVGERFNAVVGVAEQLPFADTSVDGAFAGGCAHHFHMPDAMPETYRILMPGGTFVAVEPFHAPFYDIGTKLFGKREPNAHCSPMGSERIAPLHAAFDEAEVVHHGTFTRYALIAVSKLGINLSVERMLRLDAIDDWLADRTRTRGHGSSIALIGRRRR